MNSRIFSLTFAMLLSLAAIGQPQSWKWAQRIGGNYDDLAKSLATDMKGNVYFAGCFTSTYVTAGLNNLYNDYLCMTG